MRSFLWSVFSAFSPNAGKYGPEKTPYLTTFHAVIAILKTRFLFSEQILIRLSLQYLHEILIQYSIDRITQHKMVQKCNHRSALEIAVVETKN